MDSDSLRSVALPQIFAHNKFCRSLAVCSTDSDCAIVRHAWFPVDANSVLTPEVARHKKYAQACTVAIVLRDRNALG